ncbi:ATP-dependent DNA ligase [Phyllobacterium sp. 1468]|uniref:ATP-dependent DNA ligase n=1 Tax=Phyllobacterium sp. 1468 TaxID=2817759 RepID=UPI00285E4217|nr:ATP-dependent DNA ligase [Phyllobacterium sp. 1468]MDR6635935.1 ATP-dependent DNA ligase [Phyllobacterium sp. 1468]
MAKTPKTSRSQEARLFALPLDTPPMEARSAEELPEGANWQYEPKWDGFRCLAFKEGSQIELRAKSGKPLGRYFPEMITRLRNWQSERFVVDGELVVEVDGQPAFDALQMRLHPAESRIRKLASETPAKFIVFDLLASEDGSPVLDQPLSQRRTILEQLFHRLQQDASMENIVLSPTTRQVEQAVKWLSEAGHGGSDGVVAKQLEGMYEAGERTMVKVKRLRTADCVVGGFRYESQSREVGSLLLGLYDKIGKLNHVGFTSTIRDSERAALTKRLESLREPPGFTGKSPGGTSRWSTKRSGEWEPLRPELVVEVRFDHITGNRFRHGTKLMRWRPDKRPDQCTFEQLV